MIMALGQSCKALNVGMPECTPNLRAAYEHVETIPPLPLWPMITGLSFKVGSWSSSQRTKKAFRSI